MSDKTAQRGRSFYVKYVAAVEGTTANKQTHPITEQSKNNQAMKMKSVGTFFLACENDSFPLLSSDGVKLNICGEH